MLRKLSKFSLLHQLISYTFSIQLLSNPFASHWHQTNKYIQLLHFTFSIRLNYPILLLYPQPLSAPHQYCLKSVSTCTINKNFADFVFKDFLRWWLFNKVQLPSLKIKLLRLSWDTQAHFDGLLEWSFLLPLFFFFLCTYFRCFHF